MVVGCEERTVLTVESSVLRSMNLREGKRERVRRREREGEEEERKGERDEARCSCHFALCSSFGSFVRRYTGFLLLFLPLPTTTTLTTDFSPLLFLFAVIRLNSSEPSFRSVSRLTLVHTSIVATTGETTNTDPALSLVSVSEEGRQNRAKFDLGRLHLLRM